MHTHSYPWIRAVKEISRRATAGERSRLEMDSSPVGVEHVRPAGAASVVVVVVITDSKTLLSSGGQQKVQKET